MSSNNFCWAGKFVGGVALVVEHHVLEGRNVVEGVFELCSEISVVGDELAKSLLASSLSGCKAGECVGNLVFFVFSVA